MKITNKMLVGMANYTVTSEGVPVKWVYLGDNTERYVIALIRETQP